MTFNFPLINIIKGKRVLFSPAEHESVKASFICDLAAFAHVDFADALTGPGVVFICACAFERCMK